uniref:Uncharacterized protein n=1 Tax=Candidatus Kentrum sp. MB TaxID=2138164 RepID=A0A450XDK4_9GAMM|nr:MAG: hypothetical protein BECKMB1821I_GA0114274_100312 [Candidatus Kentron sp. MB]VFK74285.1 MAG: hypothetical protein BECKMB1821H_GA0114242_100313 [Candidatus Kentron sp. MB]
MSFFDMLNPLWISAIAALLGVIITTTNLTINVAKQSQAGMLNATKNVASQNIRLTLLLIMLSFILIPLAWFLSGHYHTSRLISLRVEPVLAKGGMYQDFSFGKATTYNYPLHYIWADPIKGGSIYALVQKNKTVEESLLHVEFNNPKGSFPANVAIFPMNTKPISKDIDHNNLFLSVRVSDDNSCDSSLKKIALAFRVVDRGLTHWEYANRNKEYRVEKILSTDWKEITIPLNNNEDWRVFDSDGNVRYHSSKPDFSIIEKVVVELGGIGIPGRPDAGCGSIDIKEIRFSK